MKGTYSRSPRRVRRPKSSRVSKLELKPKVTVRNRKQQTPPGLALKTQTKQSKEIVSPPKKNLRGSASSADSLAAFVDLHDDETPRGAEVPYWITFFRLLQSTQEGIPLPPSEPSLPSKAESLPPSRSKWVRENGERWEIIEEKKTRYIIEENGSSSLELELDLGFLEGSSSESSSEDVGGCNAHILGEGSIRTEG